MLCPHTQHLLRGSYSAAPFLKKKKKKIIFWRGRSSLLYEAFSGGSEQQLPFVECSGFSLRWLLSLQSTGFRCTGFVAAAQQSLWCRELVAPQQVGSSWTRDQTSVPCAARWILPLDHQGSPYLAAFDGGGLGSCYLPVTASEVICLFTSHSKDTLDRVWIPDL